MLEVIPSEAVRNSVRPRNKVVEMESEPVRVLNRERCSVDVEVRPIELDRDFAKPVVSEPVRPIEPARDRNSVR